MVSKGGRDCCRTCWGKGPHEDDLEDKKERRSPHCETARRSPHCDCRWRREGVGGVVGAMLRERDAESKADKKAKNAESKADKKAKEAEARVAKGKGKGQRKGKKSTPEEAVRPKHHRMHHIPLHIALDKWVVDAFTMERLHLVVKESSITQTLKEASCEDQC